MVCNIMFKCFETKPPKTEKKEYDERTEMDGKLVDDWKKKPKSRSDHAITVAFITLLFVAIVGGIILLIVTVSHDWWWKYIQMPEEGICAQTCLHGELKQKKCLCACDQGWQGSSCDVEITTPPPSFVPPCDLNCGENGYLDSAKCECICQDGFSGSLCEEKEVCNITCDHGEQANDTCSCVCQQGYYGDDCSVTPEQLCMEGTFCQNGGTCYQCNEQNSCNPVNSTTEENPELTVFCRCSEHFMGDRCEYNQCQDLQCENGRLDITECTCICDDGYRGDRCHVAKDNHTQPCGEAWDGYCLNGGKCFHLQKLEKPSCRCQSQYQGDRCDLFDPDASCYEGFCLNGGYCSYEADRPCNCPKGYSGERCKFKTRTEPSTKPDSKKLIVTMTAIFVFMMIVIAIVVFMYVKNRSVREKENRDRLDRMLKQQSSAYGGHGGGTEAADDIQMRSFHNSPPECTSIHMENDTHLHMNPNPLSRPIRTNGKTSPPPCYPGYISLNGTTHASSKASIHSNNNSATSANSNHSSPMSSNPPLQRGRDGYEEIPGDDPSGEMQMSTTATPVHSPGRGDPDTLPSQSSMQSQSQGSSSTTSDDSEESSGSGSDYEGDIIDIPNPQIQAIENHIATSDRESGDYTWDEYNHNMRFSNPYAMDMSPVHKAQAKPRSPRLDGDRTDQVHILENPLPNGGGGDETTEQSTNLTSSSPKNNIYNDRLKDVVENSPSSAV